MLETLIAGVVSALATGLGALPFLFVPALNLRWQGIASAAAGGMMFGASVFSLAEEGLAVGEPWEIVVGLLIGAGFFWVTSRYLEAHDPAEMRKRIGLNKQGLLIVLTMFIHSAAEGVAIGVGFATGQFEFGLLIALVISVHNIPEGIAISIPLRAQGVSVFKCAAWSVFTSVPQPVVAVPAFLLVSTFQPLLPASLGFAGGAMIYLVASELLPDSYKHASKHEAAWGVMIGLTGMLLFVALVGNIDGLN